MANCARPLRASAFLLWALAFLIAGAWPQKAYAACESCGCVSAGHSLMRSTIRSQHDLTRQHVITEMDRHRREFILDYYFMDHLLAAMMMMTEQLTAVAMKQMMIIGAFFDAKQQLETQRLYAELAAEAHKDYHPTTSFCEFGTMAINLGPAQQNADYTSFTLAQAAQTRLQGATYAASAGGVGRDKEGRIAMFIERFCDTADHNAGLRMLCRDGNNSQSAPVVSREKDVDYGRLIDHSMTLDIDLGNNTIGPAGCAVTGTPNQDCEEADIIALSRNLYGNSTFEHIPSIVFKQSANHNQYMHVRAVQAKRSVAQDSFNTIVGMKAQGGAEHSPHNAQYMRAVFRQLGVEEDDDIERMIGDRPSYHATMEMLTKKLYQRPEFYTELYDKPVNVERKEAALRAIGLMQNMDLFKSKLRSEMLMSVILETEISEYQYKIENKVGDPAITGRPRAAGGSTGNGGGAP